MKRLFDLLVAVIAVLLLLLPICLVAMLVRLTSKGPALYWS
nr:sugar transferase [Rhodospirillales bacterium]